jgi:hypothetical protein
MSVWDKPICTAHFGIHQVEVDVDDRDRRVVRENTNTPSEITFNPVVVGALQSRIDNSAGGSENSLW